MSQPKNHKKSIKRKVNLIVGLFVLVLIIVLGLAFIQSEVMNSVRAYVRGEGLWAKAQKDAVFNLKDYARLRDPLYYKMYQQALRIPEGDSLARQSLELNPPDLSKAYKGFLAGKNHVKDISSMIHFFLWFDTFPYMSDAIKIWTQADNELENLQLIGNDIERAVKVENDQQIEKLLLKLEQTNHKLIQLEFKFSSVLSEGSRWIKDTMLIVNAALLTVILIIALYFSRRIILSIETTEKALLISNDRFYSLYKADMLGIVDWHKDGRLLDANESFLSMTGFKLSDFENGKLNWRDMTPVECQQRDEAALAEIAEKGFCVPFEKEFICKDRSRVPVMIGAALLDGESHKGIAYIIDLSDRKKAEAEIRLSATVFDSTNNGILITDRQLRVISVNQAYTAMTDFDKTEIIGQIAPALSSDSLNQEQFKTMWASIDRDGVWKTDHYEKKRDGQEFPIELSVNQVKDENKNISHYVVVIVDISERKIAEEQLTKMAHFDHLTGLANRTLFEDRFRQALLRARRNRSILALLFIDLDQFKPVNDQYGHNVGDGLLQDVAARLLANVRLNDSVARLGGDEFVILLEDLESSRVAGKLAKKIIDVVNQPVIVNELNLHVGCSVGISLMPDDSDQLETLVRYADIAMYAAKASGRNCYYYFNPNLQD